VVSLAVGSGAKLCGGRLMRGRPRGGTFPELEATRGRFEKWRQSHRGRARIPNSLWSAAVKMAGRYGIHRTARTLRVDYYSLQRRVQEASAAGGSATGAGAVRTFIQLASPTPTSAGECVLELERPGGEKMRVHLKGVQAPDLAALSQSFWSSRS
jgi:hypothetical protein